MIRASLVCAVAAASFVAPTLVAQRGGPPAQTAVPKSTALILGRVVDGTSGQPIAEAIVTLTQGGGVRGAMPPGAMAPGAPSQAMQMAAAAAARGNPAGPQRVMTGADGRFVFQNLPPGQFQVAATLAGYSSSLSLNAATAATAAGPGRGGAPPSPMMTINEGELATGVTLRLWKHAVVSGIVVDDAGEPAIGLTVYTARRMMAAGRAYYAPAGSARTDDRGVYRVASLTPGDYVVVLPQTQVSIPTAVMTSMVESLSGGNLGGGLALMDVASSGINPGDALAGGVRIGDFMVASRGSVPLAGPDGRLQAYQTVFYPNAASSAQASVVSLKSGEERLDVNLQLRLVSTSRVRGTAMGPSGPVANLGIRLVVPADGTASESEFDVATTLSKSDGTFAFHGVPPGQFLLRAQKQPPPDMSAAIASNPLAQMMFGGGAAQASPAPPLFAAAPISVSGGDVDGVVLTLAPGFSVSGHVEFDGPSGRAGAAPPPLQSVIVSLTPVDGRGLGTTGGLGSPLSGIDRPNAQGEFRTRTYPPGRYFLTVVGPPVKSATVGGRDVLNAPLEIRSADVLDVVVTLADRLAQLSGTVRAAGQTDMSDTSVLMFPANYREWVENSMNPRRARTARPGRTGAYTVTNLPPGDYLIAAMDRADEGDLQDPAFIEVLSRVGTRVTVGGDAQTLDLNIVRVPR